MPLELKNNSGPTRTENSLGSVPIRRNPIRRNLTLTQNPNPNFGESGFGKSGRHHSLAYHMHHPLTTKRIHSCTVQSEIGTVFLMILSINYSLNNSGVMYLHKLYLRYSTGFGERESRPFHEEPETFISILTSTTPMHLEPFVMHSALPARPQPPVTLNYESAESSPIQCSNSIMHHRTGFNR